MIFGIGCDIIEIERIKKASTNNRFLIKNFTQNELDLFDKKNFQTLAGNFCAKEAISKAFGSGLRNFCLKDIEILRDPLGKPYVYLHNNAQIFSNSLNITNIFVTISHCKTYAMSYVLAEK